MDLEAGDVDITVIPKGTRTSLAIKLGVRNSRPTIDPANHNNALDPTSQILELGV